MTVSLDILLYYCLVVVGLKRDIQRVAEKLDKVPTRNEYAEHGEYSEITPRAKFGSWTAAREAAGLDGGSTQNTYVDEETLIEEIQRVAEKIGESPSQEQFNDHAEYSHWIVCERLESWNNALSECGLECYTQDVTDDEILEEIVRLGEELEKVPSQRDMREHSDYGVSTCQRRFGQWSTAVRKAGFEPYTVGPQPGEDNPAWNGGYDPYYGPNWYDQREKARERDGYKCRSCGLSDEQHKARFDCELEIHHIKRAGSFDDYENMNQLDNLVTLCTPCHQTYELLPNERAKKLIEGQ